MKMLLNLPAVLLPSFLLKLLIVGTNISDAIIILALSGLYAFYYHTETKREDPLNKSSLTRITELEESLKHTKDKVNSLTFGSSLKK